MSKESIQLHDIVITHELPIRNYKPKNEELEKKAFRDIARQTSYGSQAILNALCEAALTLCAADSSGVSLLRVVNGEEGFSWDAMAGKLASYAGGRAPRHHSPCGYCLEQNSAQLYSHPERYFEWMRAVAVPIVEGLVIPIYGRDKVAIGTIWIVSHREGHGFNGQDVQTMSTFANHVSVALRMQEMY